MWKRATNINHGDDEKNSGDVCHGDGSHDGNDHDGGVHDDGEHQKNLNRHYACQCHVRGMGLRSVVGYHGDGSLDSDAHDDNHGDRCLVGLQYNEGLRFSFQFHVLDQMRVVQDFLYQV